MKSARRIRRQGRSCRE